MINKIYHNKSQDDIALEWDHVIESRDMAIKQGTDRSFIYILLPAILIGIKKISSRDNICAIDCGCGGGEVASAISKYCDHIVGIDISKKSIELAVQNNESSNIVYYNTSIENYSQVCINWANVCILNMVLSNVIDCIKVCQAVNRMLKKGGKIIITIPHPCYWPQYWRYDKEEWFDYKEQICMKGDFSITGVGTLGETTHIHRPLEQYLQSLVISGFIITDFKELYSELNKGMNNFIYPRFVYIEAEKDKDIN